MSPRVLSIGFVAVLSCLFHQIARSAECVPPTPQLIGWWSGDGNARDIVGTNNGTLVAAASFATGMVRQAFALGGTNDYISIPRSEILNPTGAFSSHKPSAMLTWQPSM